MDKPSFPYQAGRLSRRHFMYLTGAGSLALLAGCSTHPVTGRPQFMLMSRDQEIQLDQENSPHQISSDYGRVQDHELSQYISSVGQDIAHVSHRPDMPYSFNTLNAPYINAYAFPGGTIGVSRGILLELEDESELASLIGHEVGHVSARHTAQRMTRGLLAAAVFTGAAVAAGPEWEDMVVGLGGIGAGALLASYSRNQEREADELGLEYMAGADYNPQGFVGLMEMLKNMSDRERSFMATLFATHPMSTERYQTAVQRVEKEYPINDKPVYRERYMDHTANLRKKEKAIKEMQEGDDQLMAGKPEKAREHYQLSLETAPEDYTGNLKMAKCLLTLDQKEKARDYARAAREVYPEEPQAVHILGFIYIQQSQYEQALSQFNTYQEELPGNPNTVFFQGYSYEGMGRQEPAAKKYHAYLQQVDQGEYAQHAYNRLKQWGYI